MNISPISLNSQTRITAQCDDLHKAIILFNHVSSDDKEKHTLKAFIEKRIASIDVSWDLIPIS
ncbi:MAG: hypothetical protein KZQ64_08085 [gamma proteobacterium symbiont of Bathyaustriella thionipta]|nr:hypothetical protein [gamma proteobacterium symbiont of Bathyaustriella thionipta]MCU7950569.1 hypothetical protein [gamma proteobacterium symbiont of Bathyaustriella thionipta]MCU7953332.1 hypothetical protein [gamma proteobacterium symbiont of Bathyaustriella thionipta]MCU7957082.1 hypothetical protein [gamma proteobacterium symbiont of Bathyaustriella thionipta]MCU7967684.1 hypothetical protein [gamma proteobacterium symbiont of Bathyaustriella thionipta]